jgi:hypothetical protein
MSKHTRLGVVEPTAKELEYEAAFKKYGSKAKAARALGVSANTVVQAVRRAEMKRDRLKRLAMLRDKEPK